MMINMKSSKKIERLLKNAQVKTGKNVDDHILADAKAVFVESIKNRPATSQPNLSVWRIIMKKRTIKFIAAAAVVIIIAATSLVFFTKNRMHSNAMYTSELATAHYKPQERVLARRGVVAGGALLDADFNKGVSLGEKFGYEAREEVQTEDAANVESPKIDPASSSRLVVYNAVLDLVVARISDAIEQVRTTASNLDGYMQEMKSQSIIIRIPADKFQQALADIEKLGEVTRKEIKGTDVTDEMRDLNIRLQNAEQIRERLAKLLERAEKVEDALKIEQELGRVTETIELLKGKIIYLKNNIAFSTITISFNSPVPQQDIAVNTPFGWVHNLASGMSRTYVNSANVKSWMWWRRMFDLPAGYLEYYEDGRRNMAMSAEGIIIELSKQDNYRGGNIDFWAGLARRVLVEQKVIFVKEQTELKLKNENICRLLVGTKQIGTKEYGYLLGLTASRKHVYVFEAWGPLEQFTQDRPKIEQAIQSVRVR
jgi:hypothetical protein